MKISNKIIPISIFITFILITTCTEHKEELPKASFTITPDIARIGDTIYFQNTSEGADDFNWDFGDGNYSTDENPWHIYSNNGTYSIIFNVTNEAGSDETTKGLRISFWSSIKDIPTKRGMHSSSVVDGKIYVISGGSHYGQGALHAVEEYDPETDTWSDKSDIPTARQELTTNVVDGKIYAIGGGEANESASYRDSELFTAVEEYDPTTDTWRTKTPMPSTRFCHATSVINDKICNCLADC